MRRPVNRATEVPSASERLSCSGGSPADQEPTSFRLPMLEDSMALKGVYGASVILGL